MDVDNTGDAGEDENEDENEDEVEVQVNPDTVVPLYSHPLYSHTLSLSTSLFSSDFFKYKIPFLLAQINYSHHHTNCRTNTINKYI